MNVYVTTTVKVTLSDLHGWILEAREIMYDETHEEMALPDNIILIGEPTDSSADVENVLIAFQKVLEAVGDLDCLFHDKFDCRVGDTNEQIALRSSAN
jgi:hypothetical protein